MTIALSRHPDGYFEVQDKPTLEELRAYYHDRYYGEREGGGQYSHAYTDEELRHKRLSAAETEAMFAGARGRLLEVGVGEGFTLDYFVGKGWDARGIDFTADGLKAFFPQHLERVAQGDAFALLDQAIAAGRSFDLVICNNVVEHVLDPHGLLERLRAIVAPGGLLRLAVPNDGSWLQQAAVERGLARPDFWVCPPDHLSYFTADSLTRALERAGWAVDDVLAEFPVDLFLLNPDSAYTKEPPKGRNCHFARVAFEMGLWAQGLEKVIDFRKSCARAGIGRNLAAYARPR